MMLEPPQTFATFSNLPIEIRLRIWAFAAPLRPRVIQIFYNRDRETWHAWKDGCGGLPSVALVCRESFAEALKPYVKIFDTYFHLQYDTLFISDPLFTLRKPRIALMSMESASRITKVALSDEQLHGLNEMHEEFPEPCPAIATVLRDFKSLTKFTLVLSEDAAIDDMSSWPSDGNEDSDLDVDDEDGVGDDNSEDSDLELQGREEDLLEDDDVFRILDHQEEEAMDAMPKGYFRQVGIIHFQHATTNADHWDSWSYYKEELPALFAQEKESFSKWLIPNICIAVVRYGLFPSHDDVEIHIRGDYESGIIADESPNYLRWIRDQAM